jgi:hypothetical protein
LFLAIFGDANDDHDACTGSLIALHAFRTATKLKNIQASEKGEFKPSKNWDTFSFFVQGLGQQLKWHENLLPLVLDTKLDFNYLLI